MHMLEQLLTQLANKEINFATLIEYIDSIYQHSPTAFRNAEIENLDTENQGSAKVFAFAKIHNLDVEQTLSLFAEHYQSVLANPNGDNHQNIRQFMANGWDGIAFEGVALTLK